MPVAFALNLTFWWEGVGLSVCVLCPDLTVWSVNHHLAASALHLLSRCCECFFLGGCCLADALGACGFGCPLALMGHDVDLFLAGHDVLRCCDLTVHRITRNLISTTTEIDGFGNKLQI